MSPSFFTSRVSRMTLPGVLVALFGLWVGVVSTNGLHFYPDDPISREPDSQDASGAKSYDIGSLYEMTNNLFITAGYKPTGLRAKNINTIDEVPDSSWFTNRIGTTAISAEEISRAANVGA